MRINSGKIVAENIWVIVGIEKITKGKGKLIMERDTRIDSLKGIGIIFVVLGHYSYQMEYPSWSEWIWSFHMPLFFIVGGYLFAMKENKNYECGLKAFLYKKGRQLLLPYTFFFALSLIKNYFLMPMIKGTFSVKGIVQRGIPITKAFFLGGGYLEAADISFPLWFFQLYFIAVVVFYLIRKVKYKACNVYYIVIMCIACSILPIQKVISGRPAYHINALPAALIFMEIGAIYYNVKGKLERIFKSGQIREACGLILLWGGVVICYFWPGNIANIGNFMYILGAVFTVYAFYLSIYTYTGRVLSFLGEKSMWILGLHEFVGSFFRNCVQERIFTKWNGPIIYFILSALQICVLGIICKIFTTGIQKKILLHDNMRIGGK